MRIRYTPINSESEDGSVKVDRGELQPLLQSYLNLILWSLTVIVIAALYVGGVFTFLLEEDFTNYSRAMEIDNFRRVIEAIDRNGLTNIQRDSLGARRFDKDAISNILANLEHENPSLKNIAPLSQFDGLDYSIDVKPKCEELWGLKRIDNTLKSSGALDAESFSTIMIVVKSAVNNYALRQAIRKSWYINEVRDNLIAFRTVFIVGACHEQNPVPSALPLNKAGFWSVELCERAIRNESSHYNDIIQSTGIDTYYNNTIKTFMTYRWVVENCPSDFVVTIDDDYVFEVNNFIDFLRGLASIETTNSPSSSNHTNDSLKQEQEHGDELNEMAINYRINTRSRYKYIHNEQRLKVMNNLYALSKKYLYAGFLRNYVHPLRSVFSKWYISCDDYAFNRYPPFISGGACLMSFKTIKHFYLTSYFARLFPFDDVYAGMLAYKLGFLPEHNQSFMCSIDAYLEVKPVQANSTNCIGVHGIKPDELIELWQKRQV